MVPDPTGGHHALDPGWGIPSGIEVGGTLCLVSGSVEQRCRGDNQSLCQSLWFLDVDSLVRPGELFPLEHHRTNVVRIGRMGDSVESDLSDSKLSLKFFAPGLAVDVQGETQERSKAQGQMASCTGSCMPSFSACNCISGRTLWRKSIFMASIAMGSFSTQS